MRLDVEIIQQWIVALNARPELKAQAAQNQPLESSFEGNNQ